MPRDSFSALVADVIDYADRPDLASRVPRFIEDAEATLKRRMNLAENEVLTRLNLVAGRSPLPDDYLSWRSVTSPQGWSLDYLPPHRFLAYFGPSYGLSTTGQGDGYDYVATGRFGGNPTGFTIIGSVPLDDIDADPSIWPYGLDRPFLLTGPSWGQPINLVYRQGLPPLSATNATNWLLKIAPDLYLNAALMQLRMFERNTQAAAELSGLMNQQIEDIQALDRETRWGRSRVMTSGPTP
jgi:hypothetical protein